MREVINMTQEADYRQAYETLDSALRQAIRLLSQARRRTTRAWRRRLRIFSGSRKPAAPICNYFVWISRLIL